MTTSGEHQAPQGSVLSTSTCKTTRTDGSPCRAPIGAAHEYCFWHDPERRSEMLEASKKGGSRKALSLPEGRALTTEEARDALGWVVSAVLNGALDPGTARAVAYVVQVDRSVAEKEELEKRITALEDAVLMKKTSTNGYR